jgi:diguanylate cyclase (GGDEF)-like protein
MLFAKKIIDDLDRQPKSLLLAVGYFLVIALGAIDYYTPADLSFLAFYLIPVFLVTFFVGRWAGILISIASTAVWFMANVQEFLRSSNTIIPFWNVAEKLGFFFFVTYILSALRTALEHEKELARHDPLTSLANRRQFGETVASEINRSRRSRRPFTLVCIDLDDFKGVNDRAGHSAGDRLLGSVADTIRKSVRDVDVPARLGGDEFALLLPETGYDEAGAAIGRLRENLAREMEANGWNVTMTIGAVTYKSPTQSVDEMIAAADRLMYSGKIRGKNTVTHRVEGD